MVQRVARRFAGERLMAARDERGVGAGATTGGLGPEGWEGWNRDRRGWSRDQRAGIETGGLKPRPEGWSRDRRAEAGTGGLESRPEG